MLLLHPAVVHFPVALLVLNFALTLAYLRYPDLFLERMAYGALVIGWWGSFVAVLTGTLLLAYSWPLQDNVMLWVNLHALLGIVLLLIYGQALLWRRRSPQLLDSTGRNAYLRLLALGLVTLLIDGWIGGYLVYDLGFR